ncbi:MAG: hypothetical protein AAB255_05870 [Bacteroidota bacterium]
MILIILFLNIISYSEHRDTIYERDSKIIYDLIFEQNYKEALFYADKLIENKSENPVGYLLKVEVYISRNEDFRKSENLDAIKKIHNELESIISSLKNKSHQNYFNGILSIQKLYLSSKNYQLFNLIDESFTLKSSFRNCIKENYNVEESNYYLCNYYYWSSKYIPTTSNNKKANKQNLVKIIESLILNKSYLELTSLNNLIWIMHEEKEFQKMIEYAELGLDKYPKNREYLWALLTAYEKNNNQLKVIEVLKQIEDASIINNEINKYTLVTSKLKLAKIYYDKNQIVLAKKYLDELFEIKHDSSIINIDKKYNEAKVLLNQIK